MQRFAKRLWNQIGPLLGPSGHQGSADGIHMPLLGFPAERKLQAQLFEFMAYELSGIKDFGSIQLGNKVLDQELGLLGYELILADEVVETLQAIREGLVDLFGIDGRYLCEGFRPCVQIAKNLSPYSLSFVRDKVPDCCNVQGFYRGFAVWRGNRVNGFKTIGQVPVGQ